MGERPPSPVCAVVTTQSGGGAKVIRRSPEARRFLPTNMMSARFGSDAEGRSRALPAEGRVLRLRRKLGTFGRSRAT